MAEPKTKQGKLIPDDAAEEIQEQKSETLQEERGNWMEKILNERYPKVELKDGGFLTPEKIAQKLEVWDEF